MNLNMVFADLTHTGMGINADTFPFGVGLIAAYAKQELGNLADISIHKFPAELNEELQHRTPDILAMSSYVWNSRLTYSFAARIKEVSPKTLVIMGGPDFPIPPEERKNFLLQRPAIDVFIRWDGEHAFVKLVRELLDRNLDMDLFRRAPVVLPNVSYISEDDELVEGPDERITDLMTVPSPYMMGLLDRFFETSLMPLVETTRGCPYGCTFCNDGSSVRNSVFHKSTDFIREELDYIASRVKNTNQMHLVDLNFGMFKHDVETAEIIRSVMRKYHWPERIQGTMGKSQPQRLLEVTNIINDENKGVIKLGASLQSTDADVLEQIDRKNLSMDQLLSMKEGHSSVDNANASQQFFTELIVPLPGMTLDKHMGSLRDVVDGLEMNNIDIHQLTLLRGSHMATLSERERLGLDFRYRVYVGCLGIYTIGDQTVPVAETEEVVVATDLMPIDDYLECRVIDLLVKIFVDNDPYKEVLRLLNSLNLSTLDVLIQLKDYHLKRYDSLCTLIDHYKDLMLAKLSESLEEVEAMTSEAKNIEKFITGELGANELLTCRVLAYTEHWDDFRAAFREAILRSIEQANGFSEIVKSYAEEVLEFCELRMFDYRNIDSDCIERPIVREFHFDFIAAGENGHRVDPHEIRRDVRLKFYYGESDLKYIGDQIGHWSTESLHSLGKFIQKTNSLRTRRKVQYAEPAERYEDRSSGVNPRLPVQLSTP